MKNKIILFVVIALTLLLIGISYAFYSYVYNSGTNQLITGQIYLKYSEDNGINLEGEFPQTKAEALTREDNVFEFKIQGLNTSEQDIEYAIRINQGEDIAEKVRISNEYVRVYLERDSVPILDGVSFAEWNNRTIALDKIEANTNSEKVINYTLRIWIDEKVHISDTDPNADYTTDIWNKGYANVVVDVIGTVKDMIRPLNNEIEEVQENYLTEPSSLGTKYISGTNTDITNNYIEFSNRLWRIIGVNNDGTIKIVTESVVSNSKWTSSNNLDYTTSDVRKWLKDNFLPILNQSLIAESTFSYTYLDGNFDLGTEMTIKDKVGLLSADDYIGVVNYDYNPSTGEETGYNTNTYLINGVSWWTTSVIPEYNYIFVVAENGAIALGSPSLEYKMRVRPVVNLISTTEIYDGDGTKENPYRIAQEVNLEDLRNYNDNFESKFMNLIGPDLNGVKYLYGNVNNNYVLFSNKLWRIVALNQDGTIKLVSQDGFTTSTWNTNNSSDYSISNVRNLLNNEISQSIDLSLVKNTNWDYQTGTVNEKIGLLTLHEYYTTGGDSSSNLSSTFLNNGTNWWLMTPYSSNRVWRVSSSNYASAGTLTVSNNVRPSITLIKGIKILRGTGSSNSPFEITTG